jgi:hypothetical protein
MMTEDRGDNSVDVGLDMVVSSVENYHSMQHSVIGRQGLGSESRELIVGQGYRLGWAGLARLDEDRRLG